MMVLSAVRAIETRLEPPIGVRPNESRALQAPHLRMTA
jgi:hypothetical protein